MQTFIKPDLKFFLAGSPTVGIYIQMDYEKAHTRDEVFGLVHKWINLSDFVVNEGNRRLYMKAAMGLFSILTNKSYEMKNLESWVNENQNTK